MRDAAKSAAAGAIPNPNSRRRPITAPRRRFPRSIRNWQSSSASPPRRRTPRRWRGRRATRWRRSASPPPRMRWRALIREGRPEFKGEDGQVKIWTPHRPPRPEKSEGGVRFVIKSEYEPKGDQPDRDQGTGRGHLRATTAPRCCSASPARARPTPWPR